MQVGIQTAGIFELFGVEEGFKQIHDAGFDCVDFGMDVFWPLNRVQKGERDFILSESMDEIIEFFRPYKEAADRYGVRIHQAHSPFPTYINGNDELNDELMVVAEKCIKLCKFFECKYLIVHPAFNNYDERMEPDDEWDLNIERYSKLIPALKKNGVICCLENMFTSHNAKRYEAICSDFNEAAAYIDELNGIAGKKCFAFCYDTGHALLMGRDPYSALTQIGSRVETLHIHDNNGVDDQHVTAYLGKLDWNRFIKGMKAIGYKGVLSFESSNTVRWFAPELAPEVLHLTAATGKYFARKIEEE